MPDEATWPTTAEVSLTHLERKLIEDGLDLLFGESDRQTRRAIAALWTKISGEEEA